MMKTANHFNDIKNAMSIVEKLSAELGHPITSEDYYIEDLGCPHKAKCLPKESVAVYMFAYNDEWLKMGKANQKTRARFLSQHYGFGASSTLAKSLCADTNANYGITSSTAREWIETNCRRINVIIKAEKGKAATELVEAIFHYRFRPKYEGSL